MVDRIGTVWLRWYPRVTGAAATLLEPAMSGWETVIRIWRRDPSADNPELFAARIMLAVGLRA